VIWVVKRPVATWMITIALVVFGMVSYQRLPLNLMPDLSYPTITIRTEADGYAPEEVESQVSRAIEESVATTRGLAKLESRSKANASDIIMAFQWGTSMDQAVQDVREQLQMTNLPNDVSRPLILRYDPTLDPIIRVALSKPSNGRPEATLSELRTIAERIIKKDLEAMDGVAAVRIRGGFESESQVFLRETWLQARGLTIDQVVQSLQAENVNIPGGSILEGQREYLVRTLNAFKGIQDIKDIQIRRQDGTQVNLEEIAEIVDGYKERQVLSRLNGEESVELEIYKAADANIVEISNLIKKRIGAEIDLETKKEQGQISGDKGARGRGSGRGRGGSQEESKTIRESLPASVSLTLLEDQAEFIESAINNLKSTAFFGAFLAILVLFLFLRNFRATAIIGAAIPLSIIVTFAPMYIYDVSLNLMSLGGLALGIGMLVDNAVVVLENIQIHLDQGVERRKAASLGMKEVSTAVISSTLTTISVFLPISFVEGAAGQIFADLSLAVVFSLLASLAVALFFVPMLAGTEWKGVPQGERPSLKGSFTAHRMFMDDFQAMSGWRKWLWMPWGSIKFIIQILFSIVSVLLVFPALFFLKIFFWTRQKTIPVLQRILLKVADGFQYFYGQADRQYGIILRPILKRPAGVLGVVVMVILLSIQMGTQIGQALLPEMSQGRFTVDMELPIGTPLSKSSKVSAPIEAKLSKIEGVEMLYAIVGADTRVNDRSGAGEHSLRYLIQIEDGYSEKELMSRVRESILNESREDWKVKLSKPALFSFDNPLELVLYSKDLDTLRDVSTKVQTDLQSLDAITDVQSSLRPGYPEIQIHYDRDLLKQYGLTTITVANLVKSKIQGQKATTLSYGEDRIDLIVRLVEEDRSSIAKLEQLNINPQITPAIPLSAVAKLEEMVGPSEIRRIDQQRAAVISANMEGFDIAGATDLIAEKLDIQDDSVRWEFSGQSEEMEESLTSLQFALSLAIFLVYVIMASAFESILHPFVILFSVPLAVIGVIFSLRIFQMPISVVVLIGAIVLAGVVVNNAIVLVDTINRKRKEGLDKNEAIYQAARLRLRPIAITTITTCLGLLPLALGIGEGSEIQQPLAITIISGLMSSTILTLVIIPIIYQQMTKYLERKA
jgi:HAE1 family hydrophobic/amphiphilic exporter-1